MFLTAALLGIMATCLLVCVITGTRDPCIKIKDPLLFAPPEVEMPPAPPMLTRQSAINNGRFEHIALAHIPKKEKKKKRVRFSSA